MESVNSLHVISVPIRSFFRHNRQSVRKQSNERLLSGGRSNRFIATHRRSIDLFDCQKMTQMFSGTPYTSLAL